MTVDELVEHQVAMAIRFHWLRPTRHAGTVCGCGAMLMSVLGDGFGWRWCSLMAGWACILALRAWIHSDIDRLERAFFARLSEDAEQFPEPERTLALRRLRETGTEERT